MSINVYPNIFYKLLHQFQLRRRKGLEKCDQAHLDSDQSVDDSPLQDSTLPQSGELFVARNLPILRNQIQ